MNIPHQHCLIRGRWKDLVHTGCQVWCLPEEQCLLHRCELTHTFQSFSGVRCLPTYRTYSGLQDQISIGTESLPRPKHNGWIMNTVVNIIPELTCFFFLKLLFPNGATLLSPLQMQTQQWDTCPPTLPIRLSNIYNIWMSHVCEKTDNKNALK